jgi:hypothetical protein
MMKTAKVTAVPRDALAANRPLKIGEKPRTVAPLFDTEGMLQTVEHAR